MFASLQHGTATTLHTAQQALAKRSREKQRAGDGALRTGVSGAVVGHRRCGWQPAVSSRQERCTVPAAGGSADWAGAAALGDGAAVEAQAAPGRRCAVGDGHGPCCSSAAPLRAKPQVC